MIQEIQVPNEFSFDLRTQGEDEKKQSAVQS